jgi:UDP-N-acetyl-D-mannosaminuronic acid transferase (WecB/TagA/CpsF family)
MSDPREERQILGVNFYLGDERGAIGRISRGGWLVVPAARALKSVASDESYREAQINSDLAIADSAFMVLVSNLLQRDSIPRLSDPKHLRELLLEPCAQTPANTLWGVAGRSSSEKKLEWLRSKGFTVPSESVYGAHLNEPKIEDRELIEMLQTQRPQRVVITIGGGAQQRLGPYLTRHLDYLLAVPCAGAAVAFLSGFQVRNPSGVERFRLGWLFRCLRSPRRFIPRYLSAPRLIHLIWRYHDQFLEPQDNQQPLSQAA